MRLPRSSAAALALVAVALLGGCVLVPAWAPVASPASQAPQPSSETGSPAP